MQRTPQKPLSPFAEAVLEDHRKAPDHPFYDLDILGNGFSGQALERLDHAYRELEDAGFLKRSGKFVRYFDDIKALYVLSDSARVQTRVA